MNPGLDHLLGVGDVFTKMTSGGGTRSDTPFVEAGARRRRAEKAAVAFPDRPPVFRDEKFPEE